MIVPKAPSPMTATTSPTIRTSSEPTIIFLEIALQTFSKLRVLRRVARIDEKPGSAHAGLYQKPGPAAPCWSDRRPIRQRPARLRATLS
jgi:hypothetical protein